MSQIRQAIECSEDQYAGTHFPVQNKKHMKWFSCPKLMPDWKILIKKNLHRKITIEIMIENLNLDSFKKLIFTHWEILILIGLNCLDQCFPKSGPRTIFGPQDFLFGPQEK